MNYQPLGTLRLFGAVAFVFIGFLRAELVSYPLPDVASAGILTFILSHGISAAAIGVIGRVWLRPAKYLGRSVYSDVEHRSIWEYATVCFVLVEQLGLIAVQQVVYIQALRSFSFFHTPEVVLGLVMAIPIGYIASLSLRQIIRAAQVFLFGQLLLLPLMFVASRQLEPALLRPMMVISPSGALPTVVSVFYLYLCSCILLVTDSPSNARTLTRGLDLSLVFLLVTYSISGVLVAGSLGHRLLSISAFPTMKYLLSARIPALERFDLIMLFLLGNVAITAAAILTHTISLGLRVFGVGRKFSIPVISVGIVYISTIRALPPLMLKAQVAVISFALLGALCARLIPVGRVKGSQ